MGVVCDSVIVLFGSCWWVVLGLGCVGFFRVG